MRTIVYGDIHGCLEELEALRTKLNIKPTDQEYTVGDFLNKGPFSLETLRYLQSENIISVRGNHEDKFLRYHWHQQQFLQTGKPNPMKLEKEELDIYESLSEADFTFLKKLPIVLFLPHITIVHAGVLPSTNLYHLTKSQAAQVMRVRYLDDKGNFVVLDKSNPVYHFWWSELYDGRFGSIVYGHQPFFKPRVDRFSFGIDTGAVYGNALTAIVFENEIDYTFIFQRSFKRYRKSSRPLLMGDL